METLNKNTLDKSMKACPMPALTRLSGSTMKPPPNRQWIPRHRAPLYFLTATIAGLFFLFIALLIPPFVWIEIDNTGSGSSYITIVLSLFYTPIPLLVNIIIGLLPIGLLPLVERHSSLDRVIGAILFAGFFALAYFFEQTQIGILTGAVWQATGQPQYFTPWFTYPLLIIVMAVTVITGISLGSIILSLFLGFFGEYLWTSLQGPLYVEGTRRTSIVIKGGDRGTVLSIDHTSAFVGNRKGGYLRGMIRPSKWQAYDRED